MHAIKLRLNRAFNFMRKSKLIARQRFSCCPGCAGCALAEEMRKKTPKQRERIAGCVFYTRQAEMFSRLGAVIGLTLAYGSINHYNADGSLAFTVGFDTVEVGKLVVQALADAGLTYRWDGSPDSTIEVTGEDIGAQTELLLHAAPAGSL